MKFFKYLVAGIILLSFPACGQRSYDDKLASLYDNTVPLMQPQTLDSLWKQSDITLLDTRALEEFQVSHLPNAEFVDYDSFEVDDVSHLSKEDTVVVYCAVGYRSERVGEALMEAGFQHVYNLYGGIFQWKNEGHEVVNAQDQPTDSVHTYNRSWSKWLQRGVKVY